MYQRKLQVARKSKWKRGDQPSSPLHVKQVTSLNLSIYHSSYSKHAFALIIMEERKNR